MTKKYKVHILEDAKYDLLDIYHYVSSSDSITAANKLLSKLEALCTKLSTFATRGNYPPELIKIGVKSFREVHNSPYRVIYEIIDTNVFIHCVIDGRRDIPSLLLRRQLAK